MRLLVIAALLTGLCGCQTGLEPAGSSQFPAEAEVDRIFAAYAPLFPEASRVPPPAHALDYFSGIYDDDQPMPAGLSGRRMFLFPDATFILTEWADIIPERVLTSGGWRYQQGWICLQPSSPPNAWMTLTYLPVRFRDSTRDLLVLRGMPTGSRGFTNWLSKIEPEIRAARKHYDADVRIRKGFTFATKAEEILYVYFFSGTYALDGRFDSGDWQAVKKELLLRRAWLRE